MKYVFRKNEVFRANLKNPDRTAYVWVDHGKHVSVGSVDIPENSGLSPHAHEKEEEVMFIYRGKGALLVEGETFPLEPETLIFMPPGIRHELKNAGSETLSLVWFYAPPGPEQNVRILAKKLEEGH
jgi:mannose-6-phosphate isomerase-like protein (cupin superfamily)